MDDLITGLLEVIVKGLVRDVDSVNIEKEPPTSDGIVLYRVTVSDDDMGRVVGKQGRIAKSIRTILRAAGTKNNMRLAVKIG